VIAKFEICRQRGVKRTGSFTCECRRRVQAPCAAGRRLREHPAHVANSWQSNGAFDGTRTVSHEQPVLAAKGPNGIGIPGLAEGHLVLGFTSAAYCSRRSSLMPWLLNHSLEDRAVPCRDGGAT
jgi:hypothetical protein